jgi:hypothetical protein
MTGMSNLLELRDIQKEINSDLSLLQANKVNKARRLAGRFLLTSISSINEWTENNARFAAYVTSREMGRGVQRSVSDAKEITVNFSRKGSGAYGGAEMRAMYAFVNVGIQGFQQHMHNWKTHPGRMAVAVAANAARSAFLVPLVNCFLASIFGGGEDDEEKWEDAFAALPDHTRNNNLNLWMGKGFVHIPLSQDYRAYNSIGSNFFLLSIGKGDAKKIGEDLMISLLELIAYNPVLDVSQGSIADALPTVLVPGVQVGKNKTFTGSPIYNEWADPDKPLWAQVRTNKKGKAYAPQSLIDFLHFASDLTGGDDTMGGKLNFDPDQWNHILNGYVGAFYKPIIQALDIARTDMKFQKMLVSRSMFTSSDNLPLIDTYSDERYHDAAKEIEKAIKYYTDYSKRSRDTDEFLDKMRKHPEILELSKLKKYLDRINKKRSQLKGATPDEQRALEVEIAEYKYELLDEYNELR